MKCPFKGTYLTVNYLCSFTSYLILMYLLNMNLSMTTEHYSGITTPLKREEKLNINDTTLMKEIVWHTHSTTSGLLAGLIRSE